VDVPHIFLSEYLGDQKLDQLKVYRTAIILYQEAKDSARTGA
jgi:hypothetical protein